MTISDLPPQLLDYGTRSLQRAGAAMAGGVGISTLGREPDAVGLREYTARVVRDGWTQRDIVRALRSSDEYRYRVR
jgi:hypothetical protein